MFLIKEVFVDFVEVERITGQALADAIVWSLTAWGLSSHLRGQCYDGASNMSGAVFLNKHNYYATSIHPTETPCLVV